MLFLLRTFLVASLTWWTPPPLSLSCLQAFTDFLKTERDELPVLSLSYTALRASTSPAVWDKCCLCPCLFPVSYIMFTILFPSAQRGPSTSLVSAKYWLMNGHSFCGGNWARRWGYQDKPLSLSHDLVGEFCKMRMDQKSACGRCYNDVSFNRSSPGASCLPSNTESAQLKGRNGCACVFGTIQSRFRNKNHETGRGEWLAHFVCFSRMTCLQKGQFKHLCLLHPHSSWNPKVTPRRVWIKSYRRLTQHRKKRLAGT